MLAMDGPSIVTAYQAKTNLSRLIHNLRTSGDVLITRHGQPIARLVGVRADEPADYRALGAELRAFRRSLKEKFDVQELRDAGRRA